MLKYLNHRIEYLCARNYTLLMHYQPFFLLLPAIVGFVWLAYYTVFRPRNDYFRKLKRLLAVLSCFFLFAFLSSYTDRRMLLHFVLFEQVCALALVPSLISLAEEFGSPKSRGLYFRLCCMVPLIHLVVGIETVFVAGFETSLGIYLESLSFNGPMFPYLNDNAQIVFYACYTYVFKTFLLLGFLLFAIKIMTCAISGTCSIGDVSGFLFKGRKSPVAPVLYFLSLIGFLIIIPAIVVGKDSYSSYILLTAVACLVLAYVVMMISLIGVGGPVQIQSIKGILVSARKKH